VTNTAPDAKTARRERPSSRQPLTHEQLRKLIGEQLRRFRLAEGIPMSEMARRVGLTRSFISQVESGKTLPTVDNLRLFADALGVSFDEIFDFGKLDGA
jgi:transcriptional regulator with XRE-family HTH domain